MLLPVRTLNGGSCCHTFYDKGYEFDVGIHYIGEMRNRTALKFLVDQLTDSQLVWAPLKDDYELVALGDPVGPACNMMCPGLILPFAGERHVPHV